MSEFKTLKSITSKIGSGATPRGGSQVYQDNGISFIRSQNVQDMHFSKNGLVFLNDEQAEQLKGVTVKASDVLLNITGDSIARSCLVPDEMLPARVNQHVSIIRCKNSKDAEYVAYYLQFLKPYLLQICKVGGTRNALTKDAIENLKVNFLEDRHARGGLLASIDKKIELNNRINAELEAMAKTLYDYWFVQFDFPDDSIQGQGKPYKTSGGKMVYNPTLKREIPAGWEVAPLSSITGVSNESINPADYPEKLFKHFSIPVFDATNTFGVERGDTIGSNKFTVEDTDLLVSKLNPWFNRVVYAMAEPEQICSTEFVVWRCPNASIKNFMYMIATSPQFIAHCTQSATGTSNSHKRVNPNVMMRFDQPFNLKVAEKLGQHLEPILKQLIVNQRESTKLALLRDWLLPMLMNGQVTVGEAN